jgi:hypothetical protein
VSVCFTETGATATAGSASIEGSIFRDSICCYGASKNFNVQEMRKVPDDALRVSRTNIVGVSPPKTTPPFPSSPLLFFH